MRKPPWTEAPYSERDVVKSRLEAEQKAEGIAYDFEASSKMVKVGHELVSISTVRYRQLPTPANCRPLCGAKTKAGTPCRRRVAIKANGDWGKKCSKHGGYSTGPKTPEGKARQAAAVTESNRRRATIISSKRATGTLLSPTAAVKEQRVEAKATPTEKTKGKPDPKVIPLARFLKMNPDQIKEWAEAEIERRARNR